MVPNNQSNPVPNSVPRVAHTPFYFGWVVVAVAALGNFTSAAGQTYTFSVFQESFVVDLNISATSIAGLYLFGSVTAAVLIIFVGRYLDLLGPRVMFVFVTICLALGAFWLSSVSSAWQLYVGFVIMRTMGQGALPLISSNVVSIWFIRKRAIAIAVSALGGSLATGVFPIYSALLIDAVGWRSAWILIGISVCVLLILPVVVFIRSTPESIGILPDGDKDEGGSQSYDRGNDISPRDPEPSWTLKEAARTRTLWLLVIAGSTHSLVGTGLMFHQVSIMAGKGFSSAIGASVFAVMAPMLIAGQFLSGYLSSRIPQRYLLAGGQLMMVITIGLLLTATNIWQIYLYGAVMGLNWGLVMNAVVTIWPNYYGRTNLGSIRGVTNFWFMTASALGPLPLALSLDLAGSYTPGLIIYLAIPPMTALAAIFAGIPSVTPSTSISK